MENILEGKTVRFVAVDQKYARQPYPCIAPLSTKLNTYVTGQHVVPSDPTTQGNLTVDEMIGKKEIKTQKANRFPYVINPENPVQIFHMRAYDCSVDDKGLPNNPKDYAEAFFIFLQDWVVAPSKDKVKPGKHHFYLNDKDQEARQRLLKSDERYEAEKLVREKAAVSDYKLMVYMLNMRLPGFYEEPAQLTSSRLKDILIKQAEENPKEIKYFFSEEAKPFLLGARLYAEKLIEKRHDGYFYMGNYLGMNATDLARYLGDESNVEVIEKLKRELSNSAS